MPDLATLCVVNEIKAGSSRLDINQILLLTTFCLNPTGAL